MRREIFFARKIARCVYKTRVRKGEAEEPSPHPSSSFWTQSSFLPPKDSLRERSPAQRTTHAPRAQKRPRPRTGPRFKPFSRPSPSRDKSGRNAMRTAAHTPRNIVGGSNLRVAQRPQLRSPALLASSSAGKRTAVLSRAAVAADSKFESVEQAPADPILGVTQAFRADDDERKLNLGVGAYRNDNLQPVVLNVVRKAEERVVAQKNNKEYLPIDGFAPFNKVSAELMFGEDSALLKDGKIVTLQSLSGTGSLRVGAAFINRFFPGTSVYIPNPSWGNHKNIFADAGVSVQQYKYFDKETIGLDFEGMKADLKAAPAGSVVILHACAHNPTGIDPTVAQWKEILEICEAGELLPFFDSAYQGFASGDLITDAFAVRMFAEAGLEMLVSQSYAKNLGLYGERVGALHCVAKDPENAKRALSQLKRLARALYSNPPTTGAR